MRIIKDPMSVATNRSRLLFANKYVSLFLIFRSVLMPSWLASQHPYHTPKVFLAWPCPATHRYFNLVEVSSLANYGNAPVDHNVSICHCVSVLATDLVVSALAAPVDTSSAPSPASDLVDRTPLPLDTALSTTSPSLPSLDVPMPSPLACSSRPNGP